MRRAERWAERWAAKRSGTSADRRRGALLGTEGRERGHVSHARRRTAAAALPFVRRLHTAGARALLGSKGGLGGAAGLTTTSAQLSVALRVVPSCRSELIEDGARLPPLWPAGLLASRRRTTTVMQDGFRADPLCRPGSPAALSYRSIMGVWPASYRRASAPAYCPHKPSLALYLSPTPLKSCGAWRAPDGKPGQPGCRNAAGLSRARARVRANPPHASTGAGGWLAHPILSPSLVRPKHVKQHCDKRAASLPTEVSNFGSQRATRTNGSASRRAWREEQCAGARQAATTPRGPGAKRRPEKMLAAAGQPLGPTESISPYALRAAHAVGPTRDLSPRSLAR